MFRGYFRRLRCAWQRAGQDKVRARLKADQEGSDFVHFFFSTLGKRTFVVRFLPVGPVGLAMSEKVKFHNKFYRLSKESAILVGASADRFAISEFRPETHCDYAHVQILSGADRRVWRCRRPARHNRR